MDPRKREIGVQDGAVVVNHDAFERGLGKTAKTLFALAKSRQPGPLGFEEGEHREDDHHHHPQFEAQERHWRAGEVNG